jgi:hypothetical protein
MISKLLLIRENQENYNTVGEFSTGLVNEHQSFIIEFGFM